MSNARVGFGSVVLTAAVVLVGSWGCSGDGPPSVSTSTDEATVKGTVTVRGKRLARGTVTFNPSNHLRKDAASRTADIAKDGTYSITTLVGGNVVSVQAPEVKKVPGLEYEELSYDVQAGENTFDIVLPPG